MAIQQGEIAARNAARHIGLLGGATEEMDYRLKLFALFTQPQLAGVGMTRREAVALGLDCEEAVYHFADHGKAMVRGETEGFVKLIARCDTGEIIGAAAVGTGGGGIDPRDRRGDALPRAGVGSGVDSALSPDAERDLDVPGGGFGAPGRQKFGK